MPDSGAWRRASAGSTVRSKPRSSALKIQTGKSSARAVQAQVAPARIGRDAVLVEEARHRVGVVGIQLQRDRRVGVGGTVAPRADPAGADAGDEPPQTGSEAERERRGQ